MSSPPAISRNIWSIKMCYHGDGLMNDDIVYDKMRDELGLLETTPPLPADMETNMAGSNHSLW